MSGNMVGRVLNNRYKITERIGLGGMAEVYRAQDNVLGRMVAVKVMLPQYAADPTFTKRFRQEAASAAALQSPYIVSIYDWGLDDETYYIVMELLRGTDLKTAIKERGAINQRKAAEIGSQVAQALYVAHEGGIIHRDVKPQNIMIQPDGNIKVMDFGIARAGDAGLSQTSTVLGTAHYVSPEQAQGKDLTGASDIYSLGVVLYEATTGKLPFEGQDAVSVAVKQVNELPAPPSTINPNIDPALEGIIMCALEKDPANRFANASDMRHALNDYLAGRPVQLPAGAMATQIMGNGISDAQTQLIDNVAGGGTRVMPITPATATSNATKQARKISSDMPSEKKSKKGLIAGIIIAIIAVIAIAAGVFALTGQEETVAVPDVSGKELATAKSELEEAGFTIGTVTEVYNSEVDEGKVVSTDPAGGSKAKKGSSVNISVSKGNEQINVPDLKGKTADEAMKALSEVGLVGQEGDATYSDDVSEDLVATQDVSAGTPVTKGTTIIFHLSKGVETVSVPYVVGNSKESATSSLQSMGLKVAYEYKNSSTYAQGYVMAQSQSGTVKKGTTITITISDGPEETAPDDSSNGDSSNSNSGNSSNSSNSSSGSNSN